MINYALATNGSTVTASSTFASPIYSVGTVINGLRNTGGTTALNDSSWANTGGVPAWVEVNFNQNRTIHTINVICNIDGFWNNVDPTLYTTFSSVGNTAFKVQYWNSSISDWVDISSVTGNNRVWRCFEFQPVRTSKIRVYITATQDGYARLVEVEAWGADNIRLFPLEFSELTVASEFNTTINASDVSGYEQRIKQRSRAKDKFDASLAISNLEDAKKLRDFFINCGGRYETFLLKDPLDYKFSMQEMEHLTGSNYQMRTKYSDSLGNSYYRTITRPKHGSVEIYVDGTLSTLNTVDYETGIVTFTEALPKGAIIKCSGEFYKLCRFDTDSLDMQVLEYWLQNSNEVGLVSLPEIPITEVFE